MGEVTRPWGHPGAAPDALQVGRVGAHRTDDVVASPVEDFLYQRQRHFSAGFQQQLLGVKLVVGGCGVQVEASAVEQGTMHVGMAG